MTKINPQEQWKLLIGGEWVDMTTDQLFKGKKILITGGAGFIGSHIVDRLLKDNHEVTVLDLWESPEKLIHQNNQKFTFEGDGSIIGRFSLVHACKIGKSVILGDQAIVMDGSEIGDNCGGDATCIINQTAAASEGEWRAENARDFYLKLDDFECFNEL